MGGYVTSGGLFALYMQNMFKTRTGGGGLEGVEALYHAYRDDVCRLALSYTGQIADAEDISQTVFLKLMDHYSRLTPGKEKNWLLKVAANESRSMLRRRRHLVQETIPEIPFAEPQDSLLFELVQALEFKYRAVVYLFYYEGYSTQEIGEILGIRRSCVTTRLNRARAMLKREMEETNA